MRVFLVLTSLIASSSIQASSSSAFQISTSIPTSIQQHRQNIPMPQSTSPLRIRGGGPATTTPATPPVKMTSNGGGGDPAAKKIRIQAFDSMRFFLILNIVLGHFIRFAGPSDYVFKLFSQHNVLVGAFFALSGYVTAYTTMELGQKKASPKLLSTPKQKWILQRVFGYFPLHLAALALFSPVFLYSDLHYSGPLITAFHALLSITLTQAWFPMHAEVWNAPTWFLSALTFCTMIMPYCLPSIATLGTTELVKTGYWIWLAYFLPKLGYLYDFNTWKTFEGVVSPKAHPNLAVFNMQRFSPVFAMAEVLLGVIACRIVMLDGTDGKPEHKTNMLSTAFPLLTLIGLQLARASGALEVSDMLFRAVVFVPLFLRLLMAAHRNTVKGITDPIISILNNPFLVWLGNLSFPIFIVHGPVGQIFYKKLIAVKVWGSVLSGPTNFGLYLLATVASAWIMQKAVLENKAIKNWSKSTVDSLSTWM